MPTDGIYNGNPFCLEGFCKWQMEDAICRAETDQIFWYAYVCERVEEPRREVLLQPCGQMHVTMLADLEQFIILDWSKSDTNVSYASRDYLMEDIIKSYLCSIYTNY